MYSSVSCIHPMFHLYPNPRPPQSTGLDTMGQAVDSSAVFIRDPAAFGPAVIEIQHGSDGIHAQPVDAVAIEPKQPATQQEVCDLGAAVIVDERVPIEVTTLLRIFMLI